MKAARVRSVVKGMDTGELSVLVVDDEPQVVQVLRFSLEAEGYATYTARDGVEALELIKQHKPCLVVLDVMMPKLDGWSVLAELAEFPREDRPRVVMVTALATVADRARAASLGAAAYVPKPFDVEDLLEVLHELEAQRLAETVAPFPR